MAQNGAPNRHRTVIGYVVLVEGRPADITRDGNLAVAGKAHLFTAERLAWAAVRRSFDTPAQLELAVVPVGRHP